ncbi:hypothetical protein Pen02_75800 [Plantactinospora endophytica]|uniref:Uncharacterized protein n=1 Tax=Plantactinospora endophytica TaxID=673535 RepID=A0ABQ4ED95_9ACTN|nr:hypothetical protein Pen02_75800 [Plantactinospora endophytica]
MAPPSGVLKFSSYRNVQPGRVGSSAARAAVLVAVVAVVVAPAGAVPAAAGDAVAAGVAVTSATRVAVATVQTDLRVP